MHKSACITYRNTGIVIIEDLVPTNYQVLNRAQNHDAVANTWSYEGKLYAKLKNGAKIRLYASNFGALQTPSIFSNIGVLYAKLNKSNTECSSIRPTYIFSA